jgi:hypothetical protein
VSCASNAGANAHGSRSASLTFSVTRFFVRSNAAVTGIVREVPFTVEL